MLSEIEKKANRLVKLCQIIIDEIADMVNKKDVIDRWIEKTFNWYSKQREIFYGEMSLIIEIESSQQTNIGNNISLKSVIEGYINKTTHKYFANFLL